MIFKKPRGTPEKDIKNACRKIGKANGWIPKPLNVSAGIYSTPGWPDDLWIHPIRGSVWVEFKVPNGRLEMSQIEMFTDFNKGGLPVFIITKEAELTDFMNSDNFDKHRKMGGTWWRYARDGKIR
jgi:hypothetical protein